MEVEGKGLEKPVEEEKAWRAETEESLFVEQELSFAQVPSFLFCFVLFRQTRGFNIKIQLPGVCQFPRSAARRGGGVVLLASNKLEDFHTC